VAIGVFLLRGIGANTGWTHLIPGFIVAGAGTGLINPPLASTAIGVVEAKDAGMASGINTTFRQVGIATGVAALGTIFSHQVRTNIFAGLSGVPGISHAAAQRIAAGVAQGSPAAALHAVPGSAIGRTTYVVHASFVSGLNDLFMIGAIIAALAGVLAFALIRNKDFTAGAAHDRGDGLAVAAPAGTVPAETSPEGTDATAPTGAR
jgi:hypothetical protein